MRQATVIAMIALVCAASVARADERLENISDADKHAAKELVKSGDEKFRGSDYQGALNDYRGADALMGVPTTGVEVARTLVLLRRLLEARQAYQRVAAYAFSEGEPEPFTAARDKAKDALEKLKGRIPSLRVVVQSEADVDAIITIDGSTVLAGTDVELDPGDHQVEVNAMGHEVVSKTITLNEGAHREVSILLRTRNREAAPAPADASPTPIPIWAWVGVGLGGVGAIVGGVTGGLSLSKASDVKGQAISDNVYPEAARSAQEESITLAHVSTVSFALAGVGAVLATIGFVLYATDEGDTEPGPAIGADGTFRWRF